MTKVTFFEREAQKDVDEIDVLIHELLTKHRTDPAIFIGLAFRCMQVIKNFETRGIIESGHYELMQDCMSEATGDELEINFLN